VTAVDTRDAIRWCATCLVGSTETRCFICGRPFTDRRIVDTADSLRRALTHRFDQRRRTP